MACWPAAAAAAAAANDDDDDDFDRRQNMQRVNQFCRKHLFFVAREWFHSARSYCAQCAS